MKPLKYLTTILLALGVLSSSAQQQTGAPVVLGNVADAISYALVNNPDLEVYQLKQEKMMAELNASRSYLFPMISGSFNGQQNVDLATTPVPGEVFGQQGGFVDVQFGRTYNYGAGITASWSPTDWQAVMKSKISKASVELSTLQTEAYKQNLTQQVALYYYTAVITQKALSINQRDAEIADSLLMLTKDRFSQGLVDRIVLNQAQMNVNNIQQSITSSSILLEQCSEQLSVLLGFEPGTSISYAETVEPAPGESYLSESLHPDKNIRVLEQQLVQSGLNVKLNQSARLPKLSFYAYAGVQQFQDEFTMEFTNDAWSNYTYIGVNLTIPIFTGMNTTNKVKAAKTDQMINEATVKNEKTKSALQDELLVKEYQKSLSAVQSAYDNYVLAGQNSELSLQKYHEGLISLDNYFTTFNDYLAAESLYLNTLSNMYSYYATILSRK